MFLRSHGYKNAALRLKRRCSSVMLLEKLLPHWFQTQSQAVRVSLGNHACKKAAECSSFSQNYLCLFRLLVLIVQIWKNAKFFKRKSKENQSERKIKGYSGTILLVRPTQEETGLHVAPELNWVWHSWSKWQQFCEEADLCSNARRRIGDKTLRSSPADPGRLLKYLLKPRSSSQAPRADPLPVKTRLVK